MKSILIFISVIALLSNTYCIHSVKEDLGEINTVDLSNESSVVIDLNFESQNNLYLVPKNKEVNIRIHGNPTTGYTWIVDKESINSKVLMLNLNEANGSNNYVTDSNKEGMTGVGGTYTFVAKIKEDGDYHLNFLYKRLWESENMSFISANLRVKS